MTSIKQLALGDVDHEIATTRRLLERVPDEHLGWKPHEKSMTLGGLASHLASLLAWQIGMVEEDGFDVGVAPPPRTAGPLSRDEVLRSFDENAAALRSALDAARDDSLSEPWTLRKGDHVIFTQPRLAAIRGMGMSHVIHHRGQLSVYLRLLDVPLPPIYGPTADERM